MYLRILIRYLLVWAVNAGSLALVTLVLPGIWFDTALPDWWRAPLMLPIYFAVLMLTVRPLLVLAILPLNAWTQGLPTLFINAGMLYLMAWVEPAFHIEGPGHAFVGVAMITIANTSLTNWLGIDEVYPFFQTLLRRVGLRYGPRARPGAKRGLLILQIDGLSWRSLMRAVRRGRMPAVSALLALGTHRLHRWQAGVPSNTPAVQGGLFYGTRSGVPGYRWYDRDRDKVMVASSPADLRDAEAAVAVGAEPLLAGGSCINSMFGGGAAKRLMTLSAVREGSEHKQPGEKADFSLFWLNPYAYTTALVATLWDFLTALFWHVASRFHRRKRLIPRTLRMAAMRAVGNAFLRETGFYWLEQDVARGVPVIYSNFVGYDEVAHHAGPDAGEARATLTAFDRKLQRLRRQILRNAPIAYDMVLLSDHGQSESVPFSRLYGNRLDDVVRELAGRVIAVRPPEETEAAYVGGLLEEMRASEAAHHTWIKDRSRRTLERMRRRQTPPAPVVDAETSLIVCVSGGLAHIYRKGSPRPLHLEELRSLYPGLVEGLASHPGIGFVLVRDPEGTPLMIGKDGIRDLETGEVRGETDPLTPYWDTELWSRELSRLTRGEMSGDLIVNGALRDRQRVVVFEEQVGSHGGLGGPQNYPFVLLPTAYGTVRTDLQSPEALHAHLQGHLPARETTEDPTPDSTP